MTARKKKAKESDKLVAEVMAFVRRYMVMTDAQILTISLYIFHTYVVDFCEQTPYIAITSPERECGKSRLMEILELLVARPWSTTNPSEAVMFRKIHMTCPTLLWDEIDAVFAPKTAQYHEAQRALLDMGHRRHGKVPRFIGDKVREFEVFCPKVLAGIGALPDTIASRSIPIRLQRKKKTVVLNPFIHRDVAPEGEELSQHLSEWADEYAEKVEMARPDMPSELSDRMQEGCESLVAIADILGCGTAARGALVELLTSERIDSHETMRVRLLRDAKAVCESMSVKRSITTENLLSGLYDLPESSWSDDRYYGHNLDEKDLAGLLSHYGVKPQQIKFRKGPKRGYRLYDYINQQGEEIVGLQVAWERYADNG